MRGKLTEEQKAEIVRLYARFPYLSLAALAQQYGVGSRVIRRHLDQAGVQIRSAPVQRKIDCRYGRAPHPPNWWEWEGERASRLQTACRRRLATLRCGAKQTARSRRQQSTVRKKVMSELRPRTFVLCEWCCLSFTRSPSSLSAASNHFCSNSCHKRWNWHLVKNGCEAARPLVTERLREMMKLPNGIPIAHPTREQLEKAAATIGAGEPEIEAVLLERR